MANRWLAVARMPTLFRGVGFAVEAHESLTRAGHIVDETKRLLDMGTPPQVVRELIRAMEGDRD